jgi:predicted dithiol-disulfide oxidoreductase (DUF899 family)
VTPATRDGHPRSERRTACRSQRARARHARLSSISSFFRPDGHTIRHFWGSELLDAPTEPGQDSRHVGTIEPLWDLLDLTPEERGTDWDEQLSYS